MLNGVTCAGNEDGRIVFTTSAISGRKRTHSVAGHPASFWHTKSLALKIPLAFSTDP
jgi:hypothetical protein